MLVRLDKLRVGNRLIAAVDRLRQPPVLRRINLVQIQLQSRLRRSNGVHEMRTAASVGKRANLSLV